MKIVIFFSSGVASKLHKAKWQEVENSLIEGLKHAPHMPGGPKYKVIICVHTYIYMRISSALV
jgi:hypothetical protein